MDGFSFVAVRTRLRRHCRECKGGRRQRLGYRETKHISPAVDFTAHKILFVTMPEDIISESVTLRALLTLFLGMADPCTK